MSKENEKNEKKFVTTPAANLVCLSKEDMISVQNLENCIKMISFFTIAKDEFVKEDLKFMKQHFNEMLETDEMNDKEQRVGMLNIIRQMQELRSLTKGLDAQEVLDSLGFMVAMKKAVIAANPKKHGNE